MEQTHTPGPWYTKSDYQNRIEVYAELYDNSRTTASIASVGNCIMEGEANAHLIAAAPDLLAALEAITQHAYDDDTPLAAILGDFDDMRSIAQAAIAKATGDA